MGWFKLVLLRSKLLHVNESMGRFLLGKRTRHVGTLSLTYSKWVFLDLKIPNIAFNSMLIGRYGVS